jgi:antitoxin PrlF
MATATLTTKGQITIPVEIRKELGLNAGDQVSFRRNDKTGRYEIVPRIPLMSLLGALGKPKRSATIEEMNEAIHKRAAGIR